MSIASYLRVIGRGKEGARALTEADAHDLLGQVLDGRVSDLEVGAFALAMRIKGETTRELAGFLKAVHERCMPLPAPARAVVVLPSYNGARKLPNLTPLLAAALAERGLAVLVHGPLHDPGRVTSAEIMAAMRLAPCSDAAMIDAAWARDEPAFVDIETLCPPLARLLAVRRTVGLRNSGHTLAKLVDPFRAGRTLCVVNHTHPEYATVLADFIAAGRLDAMLMRGTEGEPVADARRLQQLAVYLGGARRDDLSVDAQEGTLKRLPALPDADAVSTAAYVASVLAGAAAMPPPVARQVDALAAACAALAERSTPE